MRKWYYKAEKMDKYKVDERKDKTEKLNGNKNIKLFLTQLEIIFFIFPKIYKKIRFKAYCEIFIQNLLTKYAGGGYNNVKNKNKEKIKW